MQNPLTPLLAVLALLAPACASAETRTEMTDEEKLDLYLTTAQFLYADNSLDRAEEQALKALEIEDDNVPMRRMLGWIRVRRGTVPDYDVARGVFRELVDEGDDSTATCQGLAVALERLGVAFEERARAIEAGKQPPERGSDVETTVRKFSGRARDLWQESIDWYQRTLTDGEGSTVSMNGLQRVHALLGDYEESLSWSDRLLERSRSELAYWQDVLTSADLTASEEQLFQENERAALDLQERTHLHQATLLQRLGRDAEAIRHLDEAARLAPDVAEIYSRRAQLASKLGRYETAIEDVQRFLKLSDLPFEAPEIQKAFELLTECEARLRSPERG